MKHTLLITTALITTALMLVVGCSKPINAEKLIEEDGLKYHPDTKELYSGDVFKNYLGGKTEFEGSYKDGKPDGLWTEWFRDGQKEEEGTYKDGKEIEVTRWAYHMNGQKSFEGTYKDGKEIDYKAWDKYGNKK